MFSAYGLNRPYKHSTSPAYDFRHGFIAVGGMNMVKDKSICI